MQPKEMILSLGLILRELGREVLALRAGGLRVSGKGGSMKDIVTQADTHVEERLERFLKERFPGTGIRGEEGARREMSGSEYEWVIDPIDGTLRFAQGSPAFGISVGLVFEGRPTAGIIHYPGFRQTLLSYPGGGEIARIGRGLDRSAKPIDSCVVQTGLSARPDRRADEVTGMYLRLVESAQYCFVDACFVAGFRDLVQGRLDAVVTASATPYDLAAALAIATELGIPYSTFLGGVPDLGLDSNSLVMARSAEVQRLLVDVVRG